MRRSTKEIIVIHAALALYQFISDRPLKLRIVLDEKKVPDTIDTVALNEDTPKDG